MIVGVSGKKHSGKSTFAKVIVQESEGFLLDPFRERSFAEKLRIVVAILTGIPVARMVTSHDKSIFLDDYGMTVGQLLQKVGTDAIRNGLHENAWVNALMSEYKPSLNWVVSDVRFPNESQAIRDRGGVLVRINRLNAPDDGTGRDPNHPSETALDDWKDWDHIFYNEEGSGLNDMHVLASIILDNIQMNKKPWLYGAPMIYLEKWLAG